MNNQPILLQYTIKGKNEPLFQIPILDGSSYVPTAITETVILEDGNGGEEVYEVTEIKKRFDKHTLKLLRIDITLA